MASDVLVESVEASGNTVEDRVDTIVRAVVATGAKCRPDAHTRLEAFLENPGNSGVLAETMVLEARRILERERTLFSLEAELVRPDRLASATTRDVVALARHFRGQQEMAGPRFEGLVGESCTRAPIRIDTSTREERARRAVLADLLLHIDTTTAREVRARGLLNDDGALEALEAQNKAAQAAETPKRVIRILRNEPKLADPSPS